VSKKNSDNNNCSTALTNLSPSPLCARIDLLTFARRGLTMILNLACWCYVFHILICLRHHKSHCLHSHHSHSSELQCCLKKNERPSPLFFTQPALLPRRAAALPRRHPKKRPPAGVRYAGNTDVMGGSAGLMGGNGWVMGGSGWVMGG
jgi:hypothetical protein